MGRFFISTFYFYVQNLRRIAPVSLLLLHLVRCFSPHPAAPPANSASSHVFVPAIFPDGSSVVNLAVDPAFLISFETNLKKFRNSIKDAQLIQKTVVNL
jgi:hypothetical protein